MVRIWAKLYRNEKIVKDFMFERDERFTLTHYIDYIQEICYNLDIPTPVINKYHIKNHFEFNSSKYVQGDFVEKFDYDSFVVENAVL